jgi:hypothetical protein
MIAAAKQGGTNAKWSTCPTCTHDFTGDMQMMLAIGHAKNVLTSGIPKNIMDHVVSATRDISLAMLKRGNYDKCETLTRLVYRIFVETLGEESADALQELGNIAACLQSAGKLSDAEAIYTDLLPTMRRVLGEDHPFTISVQCNVVMCSIMRGNNDVESATEVIRMFTVEFGPDSPKTLTSRSALVSVLIRTGCFDEAETTMTELVGTMKRVLGANHPDTICAKMNLAWCMCQRGRVDEAIKLQTTLCVVCAHLFGAESLVTLDGQMSLVRMLLENTGMEGEARDLLRQITETSTRVFGAGHQTTMRLVSMKM